MNLGALPRDRTVRIVSVAAVTLVVSLLLYTAYAVTSVPHRAAKECRTTEARSDGGPKSGHGEKTSGHDDRRQSRTSAVGAPDGPDGMASAQADFDGDGHTDLAAAGPGGDLHGKRLAGHVAVTYGSRGDERSVRCQLITQDDDGVPGEIEEEAAFGAEAHARDFDGDGYTDLAVTTAEEVDGSAVIILWGSAGGLRGGTAVDGASSGSYETPLAAGDFDGDGHADLALNPGSDDGLLKGPFDRDGDPAATDAIPAPELPDDPTGSLRVADLVSGDVDGDGRSDLLTFHTDDDGESDWSELTWRGNYYRGGKDGFGKPDSSRVPDGETAVVGDVNEDGHGDLIVSPRGEDVGRGAVEVAYGTKDGPGRRTETIDADTPGVPGDGEDLNDSDVFTTLDAGDVDGDGYADVVAGAPRSRKGDAENSAGTVLFLRGGDDGLTGEGARLLDESDVKAKPERQDRFGEGVRLTDVDGDRKADLAVGAPWEGSAPAGGRFKGAAWLVPGGGDGPDTGAAALFGPADFGLSDEDSPTFGESYAK
ncbi:FG-GAP and VCBS repeat-containing protein [Streptomyces marispadix]|uniref:VCBS repeat-containing protein n=1 Tax=Streptomyces marispadix TaxID=2922868 RepID=A0ABS9T4H2_9ACTN|nr:FG-GAP and VCBS repeat-containing protein [Streptomyces marispadix]MCH6163426.1 VCBS repeat-containing protein [Streptomyces marispadix]